MAETMKFEEGKSPRKIIPVSLHIPGKVREGVEEGFLT
jgi:hypothetical protein